jgi:predicted GNAT superfamily acetyltransferase
MSRTDQIPNIEIRECETIEDFAACIGLQREAFGLPDLELSPRRHLVVSRIAGGWTLGAFVKDDLVGFVHNMVGVRQPRETIGYSHMLAVREDCQNLGVGARLKWAQRERAIASGVNYIRWTWNPMQARNAHFNLNRLGATVRSYAPNFYGTDYLEVPGGGSPSIDSDRLFAGWDLRSDRVEALASGQESVSLDNPSAMIEIPADWGALIKSDVLVARRELLRVRAEFTECFSKGLICAGFYRDASQPRYLLFEP